MTNALFAAYTEYPSGRFFELLSYCPGVKSAALTPTSWAKSLKHSVPILQTSEAGVTPPHITSGAAKNVSSSQCSLPLTLYIKPIWYIFGNGYPSASISTHIWLGRRSRWSSLMSPELRKSMTCRSLKIKILMCYSVLNGADLPCRISKMLKRGYAWLKT